jgi:hypothetical protein
MKIKRAELYKILSGLNELSNAKGVKFAYAVLKNKKAIGKELEILEELKKSSEFAILLKKEQEFQKKRLELCNKYAKKDKDGKPEIKDDEFVMENKDEWSKIFDDLKKKENYDEIEKEIKKKQKEFNSLLEEEVEIESHKIKQIDLPNEITANQLEKIELIIE